MFMGGLGLWVDGGMDFQLFTHRRDETLSIFNINARFCYDINITCLERHLLMVISSPWFTHKVIVIN